MERFVRGKTPNATLAIDISSKTPLLTFHQKTPKIIFYQKLHNNILTLTHLLQTKNISKKKTFTKK